MIGEKIRELRKQRRLSLTELAARADCAKSYLSDIERGARDNPSIHFLGKLADVLQVPIEYFLESYGKHQTAIIRIHPSQREFLQFLSTLDWEWLELIRDAAQSGFTKDQFRDFIQFARWKSTNYN